MNDLCRIKITAVAESALKKLQKAEIPVYGCKKEGAYFIFGVKDKDVKKVFAIFKKPCYNVSIQKKSAGKRLWARVLARAGLIAGALVFAAAAYVSDFYVLKVEVTGSGSYLKGEVCEIVEAEGAAAGSPFKAFDKPAATGKILALPQVVFCNIKKRGSVLIVDVQVEDSHMQSVNRKALLSDVSGKVKNIVAICGTAAVSVGDGVSAGDVLIQPFVTVNGNPESCIAVGYAEIECARTAEYIAPDDSEESVKEAYASLLIDEQNILSRSHKIFRTENGARIEMYIEYLHKVSINLT